MSLNLRRDYISAPLYQWAKGVMPALSETERDAIEAGDVWWDAELFTGDPDWSKLLETPRAQLSAEEKAFLDGPVDELCAMLDEWKITWELGGPAARGLGVPEEPSLLRHDPAQAVRRPGLLKLRPCRGGEEALHPLGHCRSHRHGAQQLRSGRADDALRHAGPARLLAAAPGGRARDPRLWPHQPGSRLRRRRHDRPRRGLLTASGRASACSA